MIVRSNVNEYMTDNLCRNITLLILLISFVGITCFGQDSTGTGIPINNHHSSKPNTLQQVDLRVGLGFRRSFYADAGIALHKCTYSDVGFFSRDYYSAVEWIPSRIQNVFGLKLGAQINTYLINIGLEGKFLTDFKQHDFVITPKIGIGLFGDLNLFYGYNISTYNNPFPLLGKHQFSIVLNLNKHFLQYG